jgi:DnaK suppressor protein
VSASIIVPGNRRASGKEKITLRKVKRSGQRFVCLPHHILSNRPMNIEHFKQRLLAKEQELIDLIARFENEARESNSAEVEDFADQGKSTELKTFALEETAMATQTLEQVRAALQRIEDGTYGKCIDCGRAIEPARLEAVPWTPYCRADQERHDKEISIENSATA